ncbi:MAG TPA: transposase [Terrimicrobiaceae bacterium]
MKRPHIGKCFARIEPAAWLKPWVAQAHGVGRGRTALRYLAAYVKKSAFSEGRLLGYDQTGRLVLSLSGQRRWKA